MRAIGIDLSDRSIEIVELRQRFGQFSLLACSRIEIPTGIIVNGTVKDSSAVAEKIHECARAATPQPLEISHAAFSIPESAVFTHLFTFPRSLTEKEVEEGIRLQFSEYFPCEPDEMAFDKKFMQKSEQTQSVIVAACEKKYVQQLIDIAKKSTITIDGIDVESMSTARALLPLPKKMEAYMLIDSGARVTSLSIFDDLGLQMTFAIGMAGEKLTEQIAKKRNCSTAEAEALKKQMDLHDAQYADLRNICEEQYAPVFAEAKRMTRFFETASGKTIQEITLCGGTSRLRGFDAYVQTHLKQPVKVGNALRHVRHHDSLQDDTEGLLFANAIGLAIGLLDPKHRASFNLLRTAV
jgi:type IV pilus assembly protein PilM